MDATARPEAPPSTPRYDTEDWDANLNDLVQFGTLRDTSRHNNPSDEVAAPFSWTLPASSNTNNSIFDHWLAVPDQWNTEISQQKAQPEDVPPSRKSSDAHMQGQIDELRRTISILVNDQQNNQSSTQLHQQAILSSHTSLPVDAFNQTKAHGSYPSSGYITPADQFDFSDDSPIYSRRTSAAEITALPGKRGQRVPGGYACDKCPRRFDVPSQLKHHERKHLPKDERPHACAECGDRFLYPKDVTRHVRQKHSIGRADPYVGVEETSDRRGSGSQLAVTDDRRHRRRRDRRSTYIHHLEASVRHQSNLTHSLHTYNATPQPEPDDRRDSAIADITTEDSLPDSKHLQLLHDQAATIHQQQHTIHNLKQEIQRATDNATTWQTERDAFAEFFQHMSAAFDYQSADQHTPRIDSTALIARAKGWLNAIEMLITQDNEPKAQTHMALRHIALELDGVGGNG